MKRIIVKTPPADFDYTEAKEFVMNKFLILVHDRLGEVFPNMYDVCTKVGEEHKNANPAPYSYYGLVANALVQLPSSPKYGQNRKNPNDYSYIKDMYNDFKNTESPIVWLVESIKI
jgi:hypothetical protein